MRLGRTLGGGLAQTGVGLGIQLSQTPSLRSLVKLIGLGDVESTKGSMRSAAVWRRTACVRGSCILRRVSWNVICYRHSKQKEKLAMKRILVLAAKSLNELVNNLKLEPLCM